MVCSRNVSVTRASLFSWKYCRTRMSKQKEYDFLSPGGLEKEAVPHKSRRPSFLVEDIIQDKPRTQTVDLTAHITRSCLSNAEGRYGVSVQNSKAGKIVTETKGCDEKPQRSRKNRSSFTVEQVCFLERIFDQQKYMGTRERSELASSVGLTDVQVKTWFQNRRMKLKRKRAEAAEKYAKYMHLNNLANSIFPPPDGYHGYRPGAPPPPPPVPTPCELYTDLRPQTLGPAADTYPWSIPLPFISQYSPPPYYRGFPPPPYTNPVEEQELRVDVENA